MNPSKLKIFGENIQNNEFYNWAKYHWEFKRRSRIYKEEYKKFISEKSSTDEEISKIVRGYPDPGLTFEELMNELEKHDLDFFGDLFPMLYIMPNSIVTDAGSGFLNKKGLAGLAEVAEKYSTLKIEINFKKINSIESLKSYISGLINDYYFSLKKLRVLPLRKKISMIDFDVILKVGDLKDQGKKNQEIAQIISPRKFKQNPESAIRLVGYYYKRYKELANGGYEELRYP